MDEPQQIGFTAAESTPRFPHQARPPHGAPNVIAIVLDDTGFGHLGAFGSDIGTPHLDALAADGAAFNRFHVTSLCSPTRASFFTGRNHHAVGMGFLADIKASNPDRALTRLNALQSAPSDDIAILSHLFGGCPMSADPRQGVVDGNGKVHGATGLYVVDGSTVPGPLGVNPQITIMAMATRAAEKIAEHGLG